MKTRCRPLALRGILTVSSAVEGYISTVCLRFTFGVFVCVQPLHDSNHVPTSPNMIYLSRRVDLPSMGSVRFIICLSLVYPAHICMTQVASAEWKRALRWMLGYENWEDDANGKIHEPGWNGIETIRTWGRQRVQSILTSSRYFRCW